MKNMKRKLTKKEFMPEPSPVWIKKETGVELNHFFLRLWQDLSMKKFGDKDHCLEVATELGYIYQYSDHHTGETLYDPIGFDYDPVLYRNSLNIPDGMPLVRQDEGRGVEYQQLWKSLFSEDREVRLNG